MFVQVGADIFAAAALRIAQKIVAHEIRAGTKGSAGGGEHDGANVAVGVDGRRRCAQIRDQPPIQGVQSVRPVERDVGDAVSPLE